MARNIANLIRALRLPFTSASVLPFVFGSLLARPNFNPGTFFLGLIAAVATHLSANLFNDYADSKSGADWQDKKFYTFFGGSKLIQEKVFSEKFYLNLALALAGLAILTVWALAQILRSAVILRYYLIILLLAWAYSAPPLQLAYRRLGELVIFLLFGPALVMGGFFIQTRLFPTLPGFILSLPFGLLTAAILLANEVPDFAEDSRAGKFTLVSLTGPEKAYLLYLLFTGLAFFAVGLGIIIGYLSFLSAFSFLLILLCLKAGTILKQHFGNKLRLIQSSRMTIALHSLVGIILILDLLV